MIKRFPWPTLLITVIKRFPWPTFLKTVNNLVLNNKKNWVLWLEKKLLLHLLSTVAIINIPGLKFQFVTKHHHWLFGQNRTSFNALLLTRIKIGEDKPTQCSKTITWCKYFFKWSFFQFQHRVPEHILAVSQIVHIYTWSEKCYTYKKSVFSIDIAT